MCSVTNVRLRTWRLRRVTDAVHAVGLSYAAIARNLGCSRPFVSQVAAGKARSWRVAWAIAGPLGRTPWEIWPRLYAEAESPGAPPTLAPSHETRPEPIPQAS